MYRAKLASVAIETGNDSSFLALPTEIIMPQGNKRSTTLSESGQWTAVKQARFSDDTTAYIDYII